VSASAGGAWRSRHGGVMHGAACAWCQHRAAIGAMMRHHRPSHTHASCCQHQPSRARTHMRTHTHTHTHTHARAPTRTHTHTHAPLTV
jgi:hypothetical protein